MEICEKAGEKHLKYREVKMLGFEEGTWKCNGWEEHLDNNQAVGETQGIMEFSSHCMMDYYLL